MKKKTTAISLFSANAHSIGKVRRVNEDALFSFETEIVRMNQKTTLGVYVVADGMGGHVGGDKASASAVDAFAQFFFESVLLGLTSGKVDVKALPALLEEGVQHANRSVIENVNGGGTTFTAVLVWDSRLFVAHVGDSRAYLFHEDGSSELLTEDHSFVQTLVRMGEITEAEALSHPRRSVLMRSLGFDDEVAVDHVEVKIMPEETILLCCDGLWSVVPEAEIAERIRGGTDLHAIADGLVTAANEAGGPDNISCILVRAKDSDESGG